MNFRPISNGSLRSGIERERERRVGRALSTIIVPVSTFPIGSTARLGKLVRVYVSSFASKPEFNRTRSLAHTRSRSRSLEFGQRTITADAKSRDRKLSSRICRMCFSSFEERNVDRCLKNDYNFSKSIHSIFHWNFENSLVDSFRILEI